MDGGDSKRRRTDAAGEDIGPKLVKMIMKLDEDLKGASVESAIEGLAATLEVLFLALDFDYFRNHRNLVVKFVSLKFHA